MKVKTVYASMAIATLIATGMISVTPDNALAQKSANQTEQSSSRGSKSLEIQWLLGFIPWPTWNTHSKRPRSQNLIDDATYANNPNRPIQTNLGGSGRHTPNGTNHPSNDDANHPHHPIPINTGGSNIHTPNGTNHPSNDDANHPHHPIPINTGDSNIHTPKDPKHPSNYKEVPVPLLIPGLTAFGVGLIRKHRQEQKQIKMQ
ncbi:MULTISPECIES: hypothetical protein [Nostocales]|uniref:hypothetical protein n=1 Tax=Nostocales TaxID=1161 RepID=UPI001686B14D|nr:MULTISPECIES: hypothetical protein [Nostocales]MBD2302507.1 hypothetical protein [Nostoc sp. FACHB-190]MBD2490608.1 hypothetical protein [Aulosira sp. FACHB-615]